ncbi:hypothetical protein OF83DRAFT_1288483, partial [Amylostereum chailletii]
MLYSITCIQTFLYFQTYSGRDTKIIKLMVLVMLAIDSVHQALVIHVGYYYLITAYAQPAALSGVVWSLLVSVFFTAISSLIFESFFVWRLYRFSGGNKWLCGFLSASAITHFGMNIGTYSSCMECHDWLPLSFLFSSSVAFPSVRYSDASAIRLVSQAHRLETPTFGKLQAFGGISVSGYAIEVVTNWIISISLVYYLSRSRTHFKRTDTMINRLIAYTVSTGGLTSIITLINLVSFSVWPNDFYYAFFNFMITPLYSNSLLVTLNTRDHVRDAAFGQTTSAGVQSIPFSRIWRCKRTGPDDNNTADVESAVVRIDIETVNVFLSNA